MTLCAKACFVEFYVFVLYEILVRGAKLIYGHVWVRNVQEYIPKYHPRILEEGPMLVAKIAQGSPTTDGIDGQWPGRHPVGCGRNLVLRLGS